MERIRKVICWGLEIIKRDSYVPTLGDIIAIDLTELTDKYTLVMLYSYVRFRKLRLRTTEYTGCEAIR